MIYEWTGLFKGRKGTGYCLVMKSSTGGMGSKVTYERGKEALDTLRQYQESLADEGYTSIQVSKLRMNKDETTQLDTWRQLGSKDTISGGVGTSSMIDNIPDVTDVEPTVLDLPFPFPPMILPKKAAQKLERVVDLEELVRE